MGLPVKNALTKADTTYSVAADLSGFAADKLVMNQKLEATTLKVVASNSGYQVRGDVKINGQQASLDYRKPAEGDADVRLAATLDDASRARLGLDLGPAVCGAIPVKLIGKIGSGDHDSRLGIEADLTSLKLDNILPGWVKMPGKSGKATFNVVQKAQSTRFEDIVVEGGGVSIKGSLEVDQNGELMNANFPVYSPTEGDKTSLRAERTPMAWSRSRCAAMCSTAAASSNRRSRARKTPRARPRTSISTSTSSSARSQASMVRRFAASTASSRGVMACSGAFALTGKLGRDTPLTADLRGRTQGGRELIDPADQRRRRIFPLHRHLFQGGRRPACAGDGATDGRAQRQGRPDERP